MMFDRHTLNNHVVDIIDNILTKYNVNVLLCGWNFIRMLSIDFRRKDITYTSDTDNSFNHFSSRKSPFPAINYEVASGIVQNINIPFRRINIC